MREETVVLKRKERKKKKKKKRESRRSAPRLGFELNEGRNEKESSRNLL